MAEDLQRKLLNSFPNSELVGIIREYNMGQSGSPVFAASYRPKNDYGLNGTFIVKIGSESWARTEQNFYNKFFSDNALAALLTRLHMPSNSLEGQMAVAYDV